jgi:thiamine kinase-like enzyme
MSLDAHRPPELRRFVRPRESRKPAGRLGGIAARRAERNLRGFRFPAVSVKFGIRADRARLESGRLEPVRIPAGDAVLSSEWLTSALATFRGWPHGAVRVESATRIGIGYGLSGQIHRVVAETARGGVTSFVVKQDRSAEVQRELLFRSHCGELLRGCLAHCFGGTSDRQSGRGVLVLEDVAPARQGDVLAGCTNDEARAVVRALARVHGASWSVHDDALSRSLPRWRPVPMERDRWTDRLGRARERFPEILSPGVLAELRELPEKVAIAVELLARGPASWLHVDAHLDNVLWRSDGTAVLLDWSNAAIGPSAADLFRFFTEGVVDVAQSERLTALLSTYAEELRLHGARVELIELKADFALALRPLVQGVVGWAGREDLELAGRTAALCENFLRSLCDWSMSDEYGLHVGRKGAA